MPYPTKSRAILPLATACKTSHSCIFYFLKVNTLSTPVLQEHDKVPVLIIHESYDNLDCKYYGPVKIPVQYPGIPVLTGTNQFLLLRAYHTSEISSSGLQFLSVTCI